MSQLLSSSSFVVDGSKTDTEVLCTAWKVSKRTKIRSSAQGHSTSQKEVVLSPFQRPWQSSVTILDPHHQARCPLNREDAFPSQTADIYFLHMQDIQTDSIKLHLRLNHRGNKFSGPQLIGYSFLKSRKHFPLLNSLNCV